MTLTLMTLILMTLTLMTLIPKYSHPNISGICKFGMISFLQNLPVWVIFIKFPFFSCVFIIRYDTRAHFLTITIFNEIYFQRCYASFFVL